MMSKISDIYFDDKYGKLYEKADAGKADIFIYENQYGKIKHQFIKREIPENLWDQEKLYDIITPYGYGGPVILEAEEQEKEQLVKGFYEEFSKYCESEGIVSEFIRFHPIVNNALDFKDVYHPIWDRNTLGTNLKDFEDPVLSEFSKRCRKNVRQALNKGVSYRITCQPDNLEDFKAIYYDTMKRNDASDYYYFDDDYFKMCLEYFKQNILLIEAVYEGKTIAAGMYFLYNKTIHVHLSGTLQEYLHLSPAYVLRYALTLWGKENGYELIHHGGGRSNREDDNLFLFKRQFAEHTKFDFYIGKKIWMPEKYTQICSKNNKSEESDFFPAYRVR